jgi:hypothetical protein
MTQTDDRDLEQRLRDAAAAFPSRPIPVGAWAEHQRRLASRRRPGPVVLVAAAVSLLVLLVVGLSAVGGGGTQHDEHGSPLKHGKRFAPGRALGAASAIESVRGHLVRTHLTITRNGTGAPPSLCTEYVVQGDSQRSCSGKSAGAELPRVAVDWLYGSPVNWWRQLEGGVDSRVYRVRIWMADGSQRVLALHPSGWHGVRLFALTDARRAPAPQRLVAYGSGGGVLQAVDLVDRLSLDWSPTSGACAGRPVGSWPIGGSGGPAGVSVRFGTTDAAITVAALDSARPICLPLRSDSLAGWVRTTDQVVVIAGPEVVLVQTVAGNHVLHQVKVSTSSRSPWQVALLPAPRHGADLVALDVTGRVIDGTALTARSG